MSIHFHFFRFSKHLFLQNASIRYFIRDIRKFHSRQFWKYVKTSFLRSDNILCFYNSSVSVKVKLEPILPNLNEISGGLSCYNILTIARKNPLAFHKIFCCSNIFEWDYQSFTPALKPLDCEDGTNTKRL